MKARAESSVMGSRSSTRTWLTAAITITLAAVMLGVRVPTAASLDLADCSSGSHTLSHFGDRVYPEMGNGGYVSVHTDLYINYDTLTNQFLAGTRADMTDRATQCLTDFSLDFERTNANSAGPNLTVGSVLVDGQPAAFTFKQPTYPGDPLGQDDPDPRAHAISNVNPVSASNPFPPACSPSVSGNSQNGLQCPANKLVITPATPIPDGATFTVTVNYTGRPGVHVDGDGSTEGWFRVNTTAAPNDGSFVTTEPVGSMAWMPLNNHPSAKPTYDVYDTVPVGKTAIAAGELDTSQLNPIMPTSVNPPDANFPSGSWTWHWHSPEPIANYLVTNSIGSYDLTERTSSISGIQYYQAMASGLTAARKAAIKPVLDTQDDITQFQTQFNGPFPFSTDGVIVALPSVGFAEEMQTKITFGNGASSTPSAGTFHHENMHQWFGDNVAEAAFNLTFWKEGWATIGEYLLTARNAANAVGGMGTPAGNAAFDTSLVNRFNTNYGSTGSFWTVAPSNPTVGNLFTTSNTYTRPGTAYLALRQILGASASRPGSDRWITVMKQIQTDFGGGSITEQQLENVFHQWLPNQSAACHTKLDQFFTQWFDTAYPSGGGANRPQITGPGLAGPGFYNDSTECARADQSIAFDPLPGRLLGDPDFAVAATASSGLLVSFAASGPCTVSGSTVHLTGVGLCTITASQAGDGVYKPAASVPQTFRIMANQTIAFAGLPGRTYGDPDFTVAATATSGLAVSFAAAGDCSVSGSSVHLTGAGSCTVTASQAGDENYNPASDVSQTFAIARALLTVRPDPFAPSRQYSDPNPAFGPDITGYVNGEDASALTTLPACATAADESSAPGSYVITCSGGEARNYDFAYQAGTLSVTQEDAEATYTGDMLAFTASGGSSVNALLRATVRDSAVVPLSGDSAPGDIRNATVTFKEGTATLCGPLAVTLIDGDTTTGTASCTKSLALGAHTIDVYVNGYYTGSDEAIVEVSQPTGSFITGGGYRRIGNPAGTYKADPGSKVNFGFNLKYNKNLTNLQGHANVIYRAGGTIYQIKSTAFESLGIAFRTAAGSPCTGPVSSTCFGIADFRSKANLSPVSNGGGMTLQITLTDRGEPGSNDTIAITLWDGNQLVFSSEWNGVKTVEGPLGGGNLVVH